LAREDGERLVQRHPAHPGLRRLVAADPRPAGRRPGEGFLDHVLGFVEITEHNKELADQAAVAGRIEGIEVVAYELHHIPRPPRPRRNTRTADKVFP